MGVTYQPNISNMTMRINLKKNNYPGKHTHAALMEAGEHTGSDIND